MKMWSGGAVRNTGQDKQCNELSSAQEGLFKRWIFRMMYRHVIIQIFGAT